MKLMERTRLRWMTARQASLSARRAFGVKCSWKFLSSVDLPDSDCPGRPSRYAHERTTDNFPDSNYEPQSRTTSQRERSFR